MQFDHGFFGRFVTYSAKLRNTKNTHMRIVNDNLAAALLKNAWPVASSDRSLKVEFKLRHTFNKFQKTIYLYVFVINNP